MRKILASILCSLLAVIIIPATASAHSSYTVITGRVTSANGSAENHAKVSVKCNGKKRVTYTGRQGWYKISFSSRQCRVGNTVTVTASKNGETASNTGKVRSASCRLDVAFINVALPEMGFVTGIAATTIGGGTVLLVRRRADNIAKS
jgi:uncharacterized protein YcnI